MSASNLPLDRPPERHGTRTRFKSRISCPDSTTAEHIGYPLGRSTHAQNCAELPAVCCCTEFIIISNREACDRLSRNPSPNYMEQEHAVCVLCFPKAVWTHAQYVTVKGRIRNGVLKRGKEGCAARELLRALTHREF